MTIFDSFGQILGASVISPIQQTIDNIALNVHPEATDNPTYPFYWHCPHPEKTTF